MTPDRKTAPLWLPLLLLLLAVLSAGFWLARKPLSQPEDVRWRFPDFATDAPVVSLESCTTIEEAMLFKVMGVISNCTRQSVAYPIAHVAFLDEKGQVLDQSQTPTSPEILKTNQVARFVLVTQPDERIRSIGVSLLDTGGQPLAADYTCGGIPRGFVQP